MPIYIRARACMCWNTESTEVNVKFWYYSFKDMTLMVTKQKRSMKCFSHYLYILNSMKSKVPVATYSK